MIHPPLTPQQHVMNDLGLLLTRLMLAAVFLFHGSQKLFGLFGGPGLDGFTGYLQSLNVPQPEIAAWAAALAEFAGGLSLLLGFGVRVFAIPLAFTMAVAAFKVHGHAFSVQNNGLEYPLTLGVLSLALALTGAGRFSVDANLFTRRPMA